MAILRIPFLKVSLAEVDQKTDPYRPKAGGDSRKGTQRYAKEKGLKIVGNPADTILKVFLAEVDQKTEPNVL